MEGMSLKSLKKHRALIPLYFCTALGAAGAVFYTLRLAFRNPDVAWSKKDGQISNDEYAAKQYKFYSPNLDYSQVKSPAPKY